MSYEGVHCVSCLFTNGKVGSSISPPLLIIDELLLEVECILNHEVEGSCKKSLEGQPCEVVR